MILDLSKILTPRRERALDSNIAAIRTVPGAQVPASREEFLMAHLDALLNELYKNHLIRLGEMVEAKMDQVAETADQGSEESFDRLIQESNADRAEPAALPA